MRYLTTRYASWRRRQPSQIRYAAIPVAPRLCSSGFVRQVRLVEVRTPAML